MSRGGARPRVPSPRHPASEDAEAPARRHPRRVRGDAAAIVADKNRTPAMFDAIARRYDLLNHLLSFNIDRRWRRALVDYAAARPGERVLDVATGTGDVAVAFARASQARSIVGVDLSSGMLEEGRAKLARLGLSERVVLHPGDALALPFDDASFDVVTIAFGLRNLPDYARGVSEMARVLKPGGRAVVLDFAPPRGAALFAYRAYLATLLPLAARAVSGYGTAYHYLVSSIRAFVDVEGVTRLLSAAGLASVATRRLTGGIVVLCRGVKP